MTLTQKTQKELKEKLYIDTNKLLEKSAQIQSNAKENISKYNLFQKESAKTAHRAYDATYDLLEIIPKNPKEFKKKNLDSKKLSKDISEKTKEVNDFCSSSDKILKNMDNLIIPSTKNVKDSITALDSVINLYKTGQISLNKDTVRQLKDSKENAEKLHEELIDINKFNKVFKQQNENLKIPSYFKEFIYPELLSNKRYGLYVPELFKTFLDIKISSTGALAEMSSPKLLESLEDKVLSSSNKWSKKMETSDILTDLAKIYRSYNLAHKGINRNKEKTFENYINTGEFLHQLFLENNPYVYTVKSTGIEDLFDKIMESTTNIQTQLRDKYFQQEKILDKLDNTKYYANKKAHTVITAKQKEEEKYMDPLRSTNHDLAM